MLSKPSGIGIPLCPALSQRSEDLACQPERLGLLEREWAEELRPRSAPWLDAVASLAAEAID